MRACWSGWQSKVKVGRGRDGCQATGAKTTTPDVDQRPWSSTAGNSGVDPGSVLRPAVNVNSPVEQDQCPDLQALLVIPQALLEFSCHSWEPSHGKNDRRSVRRERARIRADAAASGGRSTGRIAIVVLGCSKVVEMLNGLRRHLQGGRRRAGQ